MYGGKTAALMSRARKRVVVVVVVVDVPFRRLLDRRVVKEARVFKCQCQSRAGVRVPGLKKPLMALIKSTSPRVR